MGLRLLPSAYGDIPQLPFSRRYYNTLPNPPTI